MNKLLSFAFLFVLTISLGVSTNSIYAQTSYDGSGNIDCAVSGINVISAYTTVHDPVTVTICVTSAGMMQIFYAPHHLVDNCNDMQQELDKELSYSAGGDYNSYQLVSDTHWAFIIYDSATMNTITENVIKQIEDLDLAAQCSTSTSNSPPTSNPVSTPAVTTSPTPTVSSSASTEKYVTYDFQTVSNFQNEYISEKGTLQYTLKSYDSSTDTSLIQIKSNINSGSDAYSYIDEFTVSGSNPFGFNELFSQSSLSSIGISDVTSQQIGSDTITIGTSSLKTENFNNSFTMESELIGYGGSNPIIVFEIAGNSKILTPSQILHSYDFKLNNVSLKGVDSSTQNQLQSEINSVKQSDFQISMTLLDTNIDLQQGTSHQTHDELKEKIITLDKTTLAPKKNQPDSIKMSGTLENPSRGEPVLFKLTKPDGTTEEFASLVTGKGAFSNEIIVDNSWKSGTYSVEGFYQGELIESQTFEITAEFAEKVPVWIKNNAKWWSEGQIDDDAFVQGLQFLIKEKILLVSGQPQGTASTEGIPDWIKSNAGWWADGIISEDDFVNGIKFLVEKGIVRVS